MSEKIISHISPVVTMLNKCLLYLIINNNALKKLKKNLQ